MGIYFNAQSLKKGFSIDLLNWYVRYNNINVICISETWCSESTVTDSELSMGNSFQVFRRDRGSRGGGVLILISNCINAVNIELDTVEEIVIVDVSENDLKFRLICCYIPPASSDVNMSNLCECLEETLSFENPTIIVGDFNLRSLWWNGVDIPVGKSKKDKVFLDFVRDNSLCQWITEPTRLDSGTILDLCLSTEDEVFENPPRVVPAPFRSDHEAIRFEIPFVRRIDEKVIKDFDSIDAVSMKSFLDQTNWLLNFSNCANVNEMYTIFVEILQEAIDLFVPWKKSGANHRLDELIGSLQRSIDATDRESSGYNALTKRLEKVVKRKRAIQEHDIATSGCAKRFFAYAKSRLANKDKLLSLKRPDGSLTTDDKEMAELLRAHFAKIYPSSEEVDQRDSSSYTLPRSFEGEGLETIDLEVEVVYRELCALGTRVGATPEDIPERIFKMFSASLAMPLSLIFQRSFNDGSVPCFFNQSIIAAIHKKGNKTLVENKRNVSMTSVPCKVMERIIVRNMLKHCRVNGLISKCQFAYQAEKSSELQLLECVQDWADSMQGGGSVDVVYTDLKSAFEVITHSKLIAILRTFGYGKKILNWIVAFLSNRTFSVKVGTERSMWSRVTSGSCQGTVLGPILFVHYINNVVNLITERFNNVKVMIYADDIKIYAHVKSPEAKQELQDSIDTFFNWIVSLDLILAKEKCYLLRMGRVVVDGNYHIGDSILPVVSEMRDLGVIIDDKLKFSSHVENLSASASRLTSFILRTFTIKNPSVYIRLYESLVMSKIMYASTVYRPFLLKDLKRLERVQGLFIRRVAFRCNVERHSISMMSMSDRFDIADERMFDRIRAGGDLDRFFSISPTSTRSTSTLRPKSVALSNIVMGVFSWRFSSRKKYRFCNT